MDETIADKMNDLKKATSFLLDARYNRFFMTVNFG